MIGNNAPFRVLLPERFWKDARDKEHFKQLLAEYMQAYPHYMVKRIEKPFAICERRD